MYFSDGVDIVYRAIEKHETKGKNMTREINLELTQKQVAKEKLFYNWLNKVNAVLEKEFGLGIDDLPDCCYSEWYEDGVTVKGAAKRAIKNANE